MGGNYTADDEVGIEAKLSPTKSAKVKRVEAASTVGTLPSPAWIPSPTDFIQTLAELMASGHLSVHAGRAYI